MCLELVDNLSHFALSNVGFRFSPPIFFHGSICSVNLCKPVYVYASWNIYFFSSVFAFRFNFSTFSLPRFWFSFGPLFLCIFDFNGFKAAFLSLILSKQNPYLSKGKKITSFCIWVVLLSRHLRRWVKMEFCLLD